MLRCQPTAKAIAAFAYARTTSRQVMVSSVASSSTSKSSKPTKVSHPNWTLLGAKPLHVAMTRRMNLLKLQNDMSLLHLFGTQRHFSTTRQACSGEQPTLGVASAASTTAAPTSTGTDELVLNFIPDKPLPLDELVSSGLEPTLQSLGLASWWPSGRMQYLLEIFHVDLDLPWWGAIILTTAILRLCVFPFVLKSQKNTINMTNNMPTIQALQNQMAEARRRGDVYESARVSMELQSFMKKNNVNPLKSAIPLFVQVPIFMSMFFGLRGMSSLPVESMMAGGLFWFTDLTISDPYYILPLATSLSLYAQIHFAADGMSLQQYGQLAQTLIKFGVPTVTFLFSMHFPSSLTLYWLTSNLISVAQAQFIRHDRVRKVLGLQKIKKFAKEETGTNKKTFRETVREAIDNWKVTAEVADRRSIDEQAFREAGLDKPRKTYKFDPTKPIISAKSRK